jgi:hypothetical protein
MLIYSKGNDVVIALWSVIEVNVVSLGEMVIPVVNRS